METAKEIHSKAKIQKYLILKFAERRVRPTADAQAKTQTYLPDFLGIRGEKEAPFVPRVSFVTSASLSLRGCVGDSPRDLLCDLLSPSEC